MKNNEDPFKKIKDPEPTGSAICQTEAAATCASEASEESETKVLKHQDGRHEVTQRLRESVNVNDDN